jgi:heme/copper-type cytochrome/quinol oxidase subunit 3
MRVGDGKTKSEKDDVGSAAKRAMSWYILGDIVLFALR